MNIKQGAVFLVLAVVILFGVSYLAKNTGSSAGQNETQTQNQNQINMDGLKIEDLTVGAGEEAKVGDAVTVNYTGTFTNGTKFDSSYDHGQPFSFTLGAGQVIPGWDQGVQGMKVGGKRRLTVPPELGYGSQDYGPIPGNSTLIFEVELLKVQHS